MDSQSDVKKAATGIKEIYMKLKNVTGSREMIADSRFVVHEPFAHKGKWNGGFGNDRPVRLR